MGRLTEIFFTAHPSCATQQKTASLSSEKGARFCLCPFAVSNACKNAPSQNPLPHIVNARTTPKNATERLAMRNPRLLSKRSTQDRAYGVGHATSLPKRARSHGYHRLAHRRLITPPSASFPPHDLSRGHADLLCLLLLDRLLAASRAVDFLRLSLTSDRRAFFGGAIQPIFLARVRVRRFAEKAFTLHHGSQTPDTKSLMSEGFTLFPLHLYLHTLPLRAIALRPSPLYV